jgi:hypothetical protein
MPLKLKIIHFNNLAVLTHTHTVDLDVFLPSDMCVCTHARVCVFMWLCERERYNIHLYFRS